MQAKGKERRREELGIGRRSSRSSPERAASGGARRRRKAEAKTRGEGGRGRERGGERSAVRSFFVSRENAMEEGG